ncbi:hypothetical protein SH139x_004656 [Planctomycetaceae bacterium SH139]
MMLTIAVASVAMLAPGCARWNSDFADPPSSAVAAGGLPEVKIPAEAAIVDVAFVPMQLGSSLYASQAEKDAAAVREVASGDVLASGVAASVAGGGLEAPWQRMDEAVLAPQTRRWLAANGLRAGRISGWDVSQIASMSEEDDSTRLLREASVLSDFENRRKRLTCRDSQPVTLAVRRALEGDHPTLVRTPAGLIGRSLVNPQFTLQMKTFLLDDGRLSVSLLPEIQHGQMKQSFVANDSLAFRMDFRRELWTLNELALNVPLATGQAIVIVPTEDAFGLGQQMLIGRRADGSEERVAVIIQLGRLPQQTIQ